MDDIERFSSIYGKRLDEEGLANRLPDNLALEVQLAQSFLTTAEDWHSPCSPSAMSVVWAGLLPWS